MTMRLRERIEQGEFVTTVELEPPKGVCLDGVLRYASALKDKVDAVNITDCPMANMRMSPIAIASIIRRELGLDAVFHLTCRDRNVIGLQSELLGAAALGVRNILVLTGDNPVRGDHPDACGVFEVDSVGLVGIANALNNGTDLRGNTLNGRTQFYIGAVANPAAPDLSRECERVAEKVAAGAHFLQTQPVYEVETLIRFLNRINSLKVPVIAGVLPLKGKRMVEYITDSIPDIHIPLDIAGRVIRGGRPAGVEAARELIQQLNGLVEGVHIMPVGSARIALEVLGVEMQEGERAVG
jgi:5,10-methylenetetrahydrofolate reductase